MKESQETIELKGILIIDKKQDDILNPPFDYLEDSRNRSFESLIPNDFNIDISRINWNNFSFTDHKIVLLKKNNDIEFVRLNTKINLIIINNEKEALWSSDDNKYQKFGELLKSQLIGTIVKIEPFIIRGNFKETKDDRQEYRVNAYYLSNAVVLKLNGSEYKVQKIFQKDSIEQDKSLQHDNRKIQLQLIVSNSRNL